MLAGEIAVMSCSLDLATECVADLPQAANVLSKKGFVVLSRPEYYRLNPHEILPELTFDRLFSWSYQKRSVQGRGR